MDIPASPILESWVLGLLTTEMGGPYTFEEVLVELDCPVEAPPYLSTQILLLFDDWIKLDFHKIYVAIVDISSHLQSLCSRNSCLYIVLKV